MTNDGRPLPPARRCAPETCRDGLRGSGKARLPRAGGVDRSGASRPQACAVAVQRPCRARRQRRSHEIESLSSSDLEPRGGHGPAGWAVALRAGGRERETALLERPPRPEQDVGPALERPPLLRREPVGHMVSGRRARAPPGGAGPGRGAFLKHDPLNPFPSRFVEAFFAAEAKEDQAEDETEPAEERPR